MANLLEVAELAWIQIYPDPSNQPANKKEEFIASARHMYAHELFLKHYQEKSVEGYAEIPSLLLNEEEFDVVNGEINLEGVATLRALPADMWLQNVGGVDCCRYMKTSLNLAQALCDDDCAGGARKYYPVGKVIKFPNGTDKDKLTVTYVGVGKKINGRLEIDDQIAGLLRMRLIELYGGKVGKVDVTNDGNPNV
jgi:hypothetical protein